MFDNSTFKNKRQRIQVVINLFTIAFFDCRLCFLFDIRIKFDDFDNSNVFIDEIVIVIIFEEKRNTKNVYVSELNDSKSANNNIIKKFIYIINEIDDDSNNNNDSDFDLSCNYNENCEINNNCYARLEETRSFLYRHFIINIIVNQIIKKSNLIFMKTILFHIKEEDNNLRT